MRGDAGRVASVVLATLLASASVSAPVTAEAGCPPPPPYGTHACILDFAWDAPVEVAYGVGTSIKELPHTIAGVAHHLTGDAAAYVGGCGTPIQPILITRRIGASEDVAQWDQAELGVGTHSLACSTGADWAGMHPGEETVGEPWTYAVLATGTGVCEGHYTDSYDEARNLVHRQQPESATVSATITCYRPGESESSGSQYQLLGTVGVLNLAEWDKWQWSQHSDEPYAYRRPAPVVLGELTIPAIGADPDAEVSVVQLAPLPSAGDVRATTDGDRGPSPMFQLMAMLVLLEIAERGLDVTDEATVTMLRFMREAALERDYLDDPARLQELFPADTGPDDARQEDSAAAAPPAKAPPKMDDKALKQGRRWVWLPQEAAVRRKGATHWLKAGVWYQSKIDKEGNEVFYDRKGRLVGKSRSRVTLFEFGKEAKGLNVSGDGLTAGESARLVLAMIVDASTGSVMMKPAGPPPDEALPDGRQWVFVPLPTQAWEEDPHWRHWEKSHVLLPGRWYSGRFGEGAWSVWDSDGNFLGEDIGDFEAVRAYEAVDASDSE